MTDPIEAGSRAAALRLPSHLNPTLAADVEVALHTREAAGRPTQYLDPVSLGSLVVSVATLAWTVYQDLRKQTSAPNREVVARHVRIRLERADSPTASLSPEDQELVIGVTVEETLNAVHPDGE
ncbi:hypothetical protein [Kitasatospora sp. NPDC059327]|uniref:hypothetical protein n=1 Tax=Kitasatospora sp. NPDC059327 TaxID=3346803 RepID=UPI003676AEF2